MAINPEQFKFIPPSLDEVKKAVSKMEADVARDTHRLRLLTPAWSPLMDKIIIGVPGQLPPEELDNIQSVSKPKPRRTS